MADNIQTPAAPGPVAQSLNAAPRSAAGLRAPTTVDRASTLGRVSGLTFPSDLLSDINNQYGGNYVIFYVNVHQDSKIIKNGGETVANPAYQSMRGDANTMTISGGTNKLLAGVAGAGVGVAGSEVAQKAVGTTGVNLSGGAEVAANVLIGGATAAAAIKEFGGATKKYKQMKQAICLYLPTDLQIKYGVNWEEADLAGTQAIAAITEGLGETIKKGGKALANLMKGDTSSTGAAASGKGAVDTAAAYGAGLVSQVPGVGQFLAKTSGTTANPKKEQLFKNVDFRTFSFSYQFFPRDAEEAKAVQEIIYQFKLHMHPEYKDSQHFLYIYPSEFDVAYYNNGKENMSIHRHTSCVLTDMSVNYGPQGIISTFEGGTPTQINMTLTFKELAILSKESIMDGF